MKKKKTISCIILAIAFATILLSGCTFKGVDSVPDSKTSLDTPTKLPNSATSTPAELSDSVTVTPVLSVEQSEPVTKVFGTTDLLSDIQASAPISHTGLEQKDILAATDFGIRLFQKSFASDKNTLISPLSVQYALAMTANGAEETTKSQMEQLFGLNVSRLNDFLSTYHTSLKTEEGYKVSIANSVWFRDAGYLHVNRDFLQKSADYYRAGIFKAPFDQTTLTDINKWVDTNTSHMIPEILEDISDDDIMFLINAISFDAKWQSPYYDYSIGDGKFTKEDGTRQDVKMMYGDEFKYLSDENSTGFIKYYKDKAYGFAALLPNEDISLSDYVAGLTGEGLHALLSNPENTMVSTGMPKFKTEFTLNMNEILQSLGMTDAFSAERANFSALGKSDVGNIYISQVLHKTFICVDEAGTRAGAATMIAMKNEGAFMTRKEVILNRPFVYLIFDCEHNLPIFIGTLTEL